MSALQDILDKMYVEEELLAQLDEEQKHILFIKMREEQVRRWRIKDQEEEEWQRNNPPRPRSSRRIQWRTGRDGDVWVWVMGDHPDDRSIDDIIADETRTRARLLAEEEVLRERMRQEKTEEYDDTDEEQLKQQLRQMRLGNSGDNSDIVRGLAAEEPLSAESYNPKSSARFVSAVPYYAQIARNSDEERSLNSGSSFESSGRNSIDETNEKRPLVQKVLDRNGRSKNGSTHYSADAKKSPLPWKNSRPLSPKKQLQPSKSLDSNISENGKQQNGRVDWPAEEKPHLIRSYDPTENGDHSSSTERSNGSIRSQRQSPGPKPPVPARPPHLARKLNSPSDKEFVKVTRSYVPGSDPKTTVSSSPVPFPLNNSSPFKSRTPEIVPVKSESAHHDELAPQDEIDKRQSRILEKLMEEHHRLKVEAEKEAERQRLAFEEQERKSREAEAQIRVIAQRAREQHQNSLRTSTAFLPVLNNTTSFREAVKSIVRPPKPQNREAIVNWYKTVERPIGTGLDAHGNGPAVWFHGILSRREADALLANQPIGAFLVRVSERIWGYTVSYSVGDPGGASKHFLVEKITEGYQFMGTNQVVHDSLSALVDFHETKPITSRGKELLLYPIGQQNALYPDYSELFDSPTSKSNSTTFSNVLSNGITVQR